MKKLIKLSALVFCMICFFVFCPKTMAYAQEEFQLGDEVIYIDGEPYYLCDTTYEVQPLSLDRGGTSSIKEQISYTYIDSPGRSLVVFAEVIGSTSIGNTVLVRTKQTTEWHYVYEESVELISGSTDFTYLADGVIVVSPTNSTSYDASGNGTYECSYTILYNGGFINGTTETTCSIYGTIS